MTTEAPAEGTETGTETGTAGSETGGKPAEGTPTTDWQAEARKWEARAKDNLKKVNDLTGKVKTAEDAGKTELQKLADEVKSLRAETAGSKREALLQRIGAEHKLPQSIVARLQGDTEDEIATDAAAMAALVRQSARPSGDVDQGNRGKPVAKTAREEFIELFGK